MMLYARAKYLEHSPGSELNFSLLNNTQRMMKNKRIGEEQNQTTTWMKSQTMNKIK
jgi:hypothetical protein